ncbi:MAG: serine/threonine protein kinase [Rhodothermales bacterium]
MPVARLLWLPILSRRAGKSRIVCAARSPLAIAGTMAKSTKSKANPIGAKLRLYKSGKIECLKCQDTAEINDATPLDPMICESCGHENTVPLNLDEFWLFSLLGGGGMGRVYQAYREGSEDRDFAVKIVPHSPEHREKMESALRAEFEIMSALGDHPCLAKALDFGENNGQIYLAMEYIEGERLDQRIRRLGRISEAETLLITLRLLAAETYIYRRGYVYRDLKPENVIVTSSGAVLYDYGICMNREEALKDPGDLVEGSPLYMPPERLTGEGERACSEIYSLGMVLYHLLTGETLITGTVNENTAVKHVEDSRKTDILKKLPHLNPQWESLLDKMIARIPQKRYQSFVELERDMMTILTANIKRTGYKKFAKTLVPADK